MRGSVKASLSHVSQEGANTINELDHYCPAFNVSITI